VANNFELQENLERNTGMNVTLLSVTPDALTLLLRTKNTRLKHDDDPALWSEERRAEHLAYMRDTIRSSWEFVDYTFSITDVSRAFTHQLVRTRFGSYAQESQRTIDASDNGYLTPPKLVSGDRAVFEQACNDSFSAYTLLLNGGVPAQDARGVLPTATLTSIVAKFNLRTLSDMARVRLCTRTQGEYQNVFRAMRAEVLKVHPWAAEFIDVQCAASGTCAFPRYGKTSCKFYDPRMDTSAVAADTHARFWSEAPQEARPIAHGGKAQ
jgi:flavin-dependent thymidylate synthase